MITDAQVIIGARVRVIVGLYRSHCADNNSMQNK